ncbi:MAG: hypothetical protein JXR63_02325 [Spirochaetales bacterium]|nr:hypothetical protein [Spirochaetales bacterium]
MGTKEYNINTKGFSIIGIVILFALSTLNIFILPLPIICLGIFLYKKLNAFRLLNYSYKIENALTARDLIQIEKCINYSWINIKNRKSSDNIIREGYKKFFKQAVIKCKLSEKDLLIFEIFDRYLRPDVIEELNNEIVEFMLDYFYREQIKLEIERSFLEKFLSIKHISKENVKNIYDFIEFQTDNSTLAI